MAESSEMEKARRPSGQTLKTQIAALIEISKTPGYPSFAECARILKRTWQIWLIAAGTIFGLMVVIPLLEGVAERYRDAREIRHERAVASVTPERLVARCGQPAEFVTKNIYPIIVRTIRYQFKGSEKVLLVFSKTAEEKSDWVFLAMTDESGARSYDTPDAKIAALPCLDSKE